MLQRNSLPLAALAFAAIAFCTPQRAEATSINFSATTSGCFTTSSCTPASPTPTAGSVTTSYDLKFTGIGTSAPSTATLAVGGPSGSISLGTFSIPSTSQAINPNGNDPTLFDLLVVFSDPNAGSQLFSATIQGKIVGNSQIQNYLWVDFPAAANTFTFTDQGGGTFQLVVNDTANLSYVSSVGSTSVPVTGTISNITAGNTNGLSATPEPASLLLLGTGMLGTAIAARRRRTAGKKSEQK